MSILLDTHVWVWSQAQPEKLGPRAVELLTDAEVLLFVSTVSTLELACLMARGRLKFSQDLDDWVSQSIDLLGATTLELSHAVAAAAYRLPGKLHQDPADRLLAASARAHELKLMTADERLLAYRSVRTIDARR